MGSVRMGSDAHGSACDPSGRVRAATRGQAIVRGLYVGDGSVFPTGIGVNPMITIMALARRLARVIQAET
jgi:choline dehydrogenase-like flavoprotein